MTQWLVNGMPDGSLSPQDRGLTYGDGLFETIALRAGKFRLLDFHLERLQVGCERLGIPPPATELLRAELKQVAVNCTSGTGKIIITRGCGPRGYRAPAQAQATRLVGLFPDSAGSLPSWRDGIRVRWCRTPVAENPALAGLKTLNRLEQVLARSEWEDEAITEGLMSTPQGQVIGGTMSNLFMVDDGQLLTPDLSRCGISGVMRRLILKVAAELAINAFEQSIDAERLLAADEVFLSNSLQGIAPVIQLDDQPLPIGPVSRKLMQALSQRGVSECAAA
jgi:4-amino-4-deoxychorismate lyase